MPDTFDHAYIDLEIASLTDLKDGFSWRAPWQLPLIALAEYTHRLKQEGHLFIRAPVARSPFVDGVAAAFTGMVKEYRLGQIDKVTSIEVPIHGRSSVYELMLDIRKTTTINPAAIRSEIQASNGQLRFSTVPNDVVLLTTDTTGLEPLSYNFLPPKQKKE